MCASLALPAAATAQNSRPPITIPPAQIPAPGEAPIQPPAQPTMRALLPSNVNVLHDPQGTGIVMYGALTAKAPSALAVTQGIFTYSQAFDPIPALPLVIADQDDRHAQALFTAAVGGAPVIGIAVVSLGDKTGDISVFYDYAGSFAGSLARLRQALADGGGAATVALSPFHLGDGNQIGVPPGWRVISQGMGLVDLMGTQGEFISLGAATPVRGSGPAGTMPQASCCDPVNALRTLYPQLAATAQRAGSPVQQITEIVESQSTPAPTGGDSAFVLANLTVSGRAFSYFALVQALAGFTDPWTFTLSGVTAPQPVFAEEFPALLRIWRSYSGGPPDFADRLRQALRNMPATQRLMASAITSRQTAEYNASPAWDALIPAIAADPKPPIDDTKAQNIAAKLAADTARPWRVVPAAELK